VEAAKDAAKVVGTWVESINLGVVNTSAFWSSLNGDHSEWLASEDQELLKAVFNPGLSDRRADGDLFVPPDASQAYVEKLRQLVGRELEVKQQRKAHFLSAAFVPGAAGPLFPLSWTSEVEVTAGQASQSAAQREKLCACPEYQAQADALKPVLRTVTPTFDEQTEDGIRFRIYQFGPVEVRTTQEEDKEEVVGAIYSIENPPAADASSEAMQAMGSDKLTKVTEYVEREVSGGRHYFVVLETQQGYKILTEKTCEGTIVWQESSRHFALRLAQAKATWSVACSQSGATVATMRDYRSRQLAKGPAAQGGSQSKHYARGAYTLVARRMKIIKESKEQSVFAHLRVPRK
jgi:hypothetical protein